MEILLTLCFDGRHVPFLHVISLLCLLFTTVQWFHKFSYLLLTTSWTLIRFFRLLRVYVVISKVVMTNQIFAILVISYSNLWLGSNWLYIYSDFRKLVIKYQSTPFDFSSAPRKSLLAIPLNYSNTSHEFFVTRFFFDLREFSVKDFMTELSKMSAVLFSIF